jgi:hypothetical protein
MSTLSNILAFILITLNLALFLNAYLKGIRVLRKSRDKSYARNSPAE